MSTEEQEHAWRILGKTPYEAWHDRKPKVHHLRMFGCVAYVKRVGPGVTKLSDRSTPMVFIGYESGTKRYRLYDPVAKKLHISRDVIFQENEAWKWSGADQADPVVSRFEVEFFTVVRQGTAADSGDSEEQAENSENSVGPDHEPFSDGEWSVNTGSEAAQVNTPPGSPAAQGVEFATPPTGESISSDGVPMRFRTIGNINDTTEEVTDFEYSGVCYLAAEEPGSVEEALNEKCWRDAMEAEMQSIQCNKTWEPAGHRAIGLKWVFKVKKDPEGNVIKHKARLVAKGYAQR